MKPKFEVVYRGKMFEVVQWEGKPGVTFESAVRAPGVRLIIETKKIGQQENKKALLMTREIRREAGGYDYRLPGGKVFDTLAELDAHRQSGADIGPFIKQTLEREGREEAGISGGNYEQIEVSHAGSSVEWDLYYFLVTGATIGDRDVAEEERGDIETVILSAEEIFEKLTNREIKEGRSADILWSWLLKNNFVSFVGN